MKAAIMQPYFLPYYGYFSLIHSVDLFIFYDDVAYIKKGWINRNKILLNNTEFTFTIPVQNASQNKLIKEIYLHEKEQWEDKFLKTIERAYKKAKNYKEIYPIIEKIVKYKTEKISDLAQFSIITISEYLGLEAKFKKSSDIGGINSEQERADRLIEICQSQSCTNYHNSIGGKILYSEDYFLKNGIDLKFVEPYGITYNQFGSDFIPNLSILDILMFNSRDEVLELITSYRLTGN